MKKYIAGMLVAAAALVASVAPSWAFQSVSITTITAQTTTGGTRTAAFTLVIRNVGTPLTGSVGTVNWTGVDPLSTTWKIADQLLVINSTVTDAGGGIKIYTDNNHAAANPRFIPPTAVSTAPTSVAAGLVKVPAVGTTTSEAPLPMAWSIKTASKTVESGTVDTGIGAADPQTGPETATRDNRFQWLNMTDKLNWASGTDYNGDGDTTDPGDSGVKALDDPFLVMINKIGIHFGQAPTEFGAHPDGQNSFVYLEANFATADVQQAYRTNTLRVEAFIQ
jgi:hypothetical protein